MADPAFIGHAPELERLRSFLARALAGQGTVAFVSGEAGAGKTTLLQEFARRAQAEHDDLVVALGQCNAQTGLGDPYLPFREVLRLLAGDVEGDLADNVVNTENASRLRQILTHSGDILLELTPDIVGLLLSGIPLAGFLVGAGKVLAEKAGWLDRLRKLGQSEKAPAPDAELDQARLLEQYTGFLKALAQRQPVVLILDDAQWADAASLGLLFHLSRALASSRVLILCAYRSDEVALGRAGERHPLEKVLAEVKRYQGDVALDLSAAGRAGGREFVDALLDSEPNALGPVFRQALWQRTDGHPLFTIELLRHMQERGDLYYDEQGRLAARPDLDWQALPARVEGVIQERLGRLEPPLRELLATASVEGCEFTVEVLLRLAPRPERELLTELAQHLDRRHNLVHEQGEVKVGRQVLLHYHFAHALFQSYLYGELSSRQRRLLHGEVARILEELWAGHTADITMHLARHYAEAGDAERAVPYLLAAGDRARALFAYAEAAGHYRRALELLQEIADYPRLARTQMKLALTYHLAADFEQARATYEDAFATWQAVGESQSGLDVPPAPHPLRLQRDNPTSFDPALAVNLTTIPFVDQLFAGLVEIGPELDVLPSLAERWEIGDGGKRYVFYLRAGARWSDGSPLTAEDFVFAWQRVLDPATRSPAADLLFDVRGARAYHETGAGALGISAPDRYTLEVDLETPNGQFLYLVGQTCLFAAPRHTIAAHGAGWSVTERLVTSGPFRVASLVPHDLLVLERDSGFAGLRSGNAERVEASLGERGASLARYEAGELDMVSLDYLPLADADRARQRHAGEYVAGPTLMTWFVALDVTRPPLDDARLRRALVQAADRKLLADVLLRGFYFPATGGYVPPGMSGHVPGAGLPFDPAEARRQLAEAGYPQGQGLPPFCLHARRQHQVTAQFLAEQWRRNLGLQVAIEYVQFPGDPCSDPNALTLRFDGWLADLPEPGNFLDLGVRYAVAGWQNPAYAQLLANASRAETPDKRIAAYQQADRLLMQEAPLMPVTYNRFNILVKPYVRRFATSPLKMWFWKDVVIEPHGED